MFECWAYSYVITMASDVLDQAGFTQVSSAVVASDATAVTHCGKGCIRSKKLFDMSREEVAQVEQGEVLQLLQQQRNSEPRP